MSQVSKINGFRPVKSLASPWAGQIETFFVPASDATVIMVGDAVSLLGDARAASRVASATGVPLGIVVGISFEGQGDLTNIPPVNDLNAPIYRSTLTDRYIT